MGGRGVAWEEVGVAISCFGVVSGAGHPLLHLTGTKV